MIIYSDSVFFCDIVTEIPWKYVYTEGIFKTDRRNEIYDHYQ